MPSDGIISKKTISEAATVVKDRVDLRDLQYQPTLRPLVGARAVPVQLGDGRVRVRDQFAEASGAHVGTCTAQALAAVIDILRLEDSPDAPGVSAGMIYRHGRDIEELETGSPNEGLRSLRSAIKGFYHNGVCTDALWQTKGASLADEQRIVIERFGEARKVPLGSYYRLQPILNDYHAALNEVGVIYAAAEIHGGWAQEHVDQNGGKIALLDEIKAREVMGNHAFAIVGYTPDGFLVLNSWGPEWGRYKVKPQTKNNGAEPAGAPIPGVALWTYQDWAERIIDGWVLRLGVSAPEAFRFSFGRQGLGDFISGEIKVGSTPRHELLGHYVHMDDGKFVTTGSIPSDVESLQATCRRLEDNRVPEGPDGSLRKRYDKILLWLPGGSEGTRDLLGHIASTKDYWKSRQVYPVTALWCSDLMDQASSLLDKIEQSAFELVRAPGPDLDRRIEHEARAIGRAIWRDVLHSAAEAAKKGTSNDRKKAAIDGAMRQTFQILSKLNADIEIHVVAEGAGAVLLHELLRNFNKNEDLRIKTISLIMPACTVSDFKQMYEDWLSQWHSKLHVFVPDKATSQRFGLGRYQGSLLDLAQMAFVENPPRRSSRGADAKSGKKQRVLATDDGSRLLGLLKKAEIEKKFPGLDVKEIRHPGGAGRIGSLRAVSAGKQASDLIHEVLFGHRPETSAPDYGGNRPAPRGDEVRASAKNNLVNALINTSGL
jgi:hypothetical protein